MRVRLHSFRARALLACVPALGLVLAAGVGTASAAHTPANARAELRTALEHLLSVHPNSRGAHWASIGGTDLKKVSSENWSGYADTGTGFSSVSGTWTEPKVTGCSATGPLKAVAFWVGFDGFSRTSMTVEQGGTLAICGTGFGPLTYLTWHEMCCKQAITPFGNETVKPGDKISASVVRSGTKYTIKVTDSTTSGNSGTSTATCSTCANSSAEWIAEAPSGTSGELVLPKFSTWTLSNAAVTAGSKSGTIKAFTDDEITMNNSSPHNVAKPGALNSAGSSFKDVWKA
jgi:Peptidase A4 family